MSPQPKPATRWGAAAALALALTSLSLASSAQAAPNPISSGLMTINLKGSFSSALKHAKVKLTAIAPATLKGKSISFPVNSGTLDSDSAQGGIGEEGALKLKGPRGSAVLREFTLKTSPTPLYAVVGGAHIKLSTGQGQSLSRDGFGSDVSFASLALTHNFAERLNTLLKLKSAFKQGQKLGSVRATAQPETVAIAPTGALTLNPDPATFAKLRERHVSFNPIFPAELSTGTFDFPLISAGAISPDASLGTLRSGGSIELLRLFEEGKKGYGQIILHEIWLNLAAHNATVELDVEPSPPYGGRKLQAAVLELNMSAATISSNPAARTIAVSGATATFNQALASAFNEALAKEEGEVFKAGDVLGTLSFTAREE